MIRHSISRAVSILACLFCCGCQSQLDSSVQGTVTIDGVLADHGTIAFYPAAGGAPAYGNIAKNGSYSLRVGQGNLRDEDASRIRSGDYVVTVVVNAAAQNGETLGEAGPPKPGPRITAEKFATKDASPLHVVVKPGPNVVPLELEGAAQTEAETVNATETMAGPPAATQPDASQEGEKSEGAKQ